MENRSKEKQQDTLLFITPVLEQRVAKMLNSFSKLKLHATVIYPIGRENKLFNKTIPFESELLHYTYSIHPQFKYDFKLIRSIKKLLKYTSCVKNVKYILFRDIFLFDFFFLYCKKNFPKAKIFVDIADNFELTDGLYSRFSIRGAYQKGVSLSGLKKASEADGIFVVCRENKERIHSEFGIPKEKIFVIENTPMRSQSNIDNPIYEKEKRTIVYSGQLNHKIRNFSAIFEALKESSWKLHLYITNGPSAEEVLLKQEIKRLAIEDKVIFHDPVPFESSIKILAKYEVGLIPHNNIGHVRYTLPNKLYDYLLAGLPILVKSVPILNTYVSNNKIGYVYENTENVRAFFRLFENGKIEIDSTNIMRIREMICWEDNAEKELAVPFS